MSDLIYYCKQENNTCPKKEVCERYMNVQGNNCATLFKAACTQGNNYQLFIKYEPKEESKNG